ncbi:MAG: hypothetical protein LH474_12535 [Chamaesiphon sp.]|nr:hypothetical protein [Chamaesiphon sp.]
MHSATRLDDLKILECFLQNSLHAHLGRIIPFRVQCLYKDDTLWVLAQHPADVAIDIPDIFKVLERALQAEEPKIPLTVKLYLRAEGNQRPYSHQSFAVYPLVKKTIPGEAAPEMTAMSEDRIALERDGYTDSGDTRRSSTTSDPDRPQLDDDLQAKIPLQPSDRHQTPSNTPSTIPEIMSSFNDFPQSNPAEDRLVTIDTDVFAADIENSFGSTRDDEYHSSTPPTKNKRKLLMPILGGLGLLAIGSGGAYMGTRPCVFSTCTQLTTATQLTQSSLAVVNTSGVTGEQVLTAQKQLHQSIENLNSIPVWSGNYGTAQKTLQATTAHAADLDTAVIAMNRAYKATMSVKNPPIPLSKWQESKQMWTDSIANLGTIPTSSQIYPLARQKLTDYQVRLGDIERRIVIETTADQKLKSAVDGIKAATQSQLTASSLVQWRAVKTQWTQASDQLNSIPANTNAYGQAQELLKSYQAKITTAQEKVLEEDKAAQNYQLAIKLAASAKLSQKSNKLAQAVSEWNQSVVAIQSVPQNSVIYAQAKPLAFEYTKSFQQAEKKLKITQKMSLANKDLQRTCAGSPQICTYTVNNKAIVVRLMSLYTQTLSQTAMAASTQGDSTAKAGILNHVNTLGNALQTISENAKLPLEIYGADGKQIQNYRP